METPLNTNNTPVFIVVNINKGIIFRKTKTTVVIGYFPAKNKDVFI
jgi:hypothetical protein